MYISYRCVSIHKLCYNSYVYYAATICVCKCICVHYASFARVCVCVYLCVACGFPLCSEGNWWAQLLGEEVCV